LLPQDAELVIKRKELVLKRGYERRLEGKRVLIVEDILTTGNSARHAVEAARKAGGVVDIVAAICNGGELTAEQLGVSHLVSLLNFKRNTFPGNNCPLCNSGIPINTTVGHGKEFLEKQASKA
jgi:orotate phosphoribosyltransferase